MLKSWTWTANFTSNCQALIEEFLARENLWPQDSSRTGCASRIGTREDRLAAPTEFPDCRSGVWGGGIMWGGNNVGGGGGTGGGHNGGGWGGRGGIRWGGNNGGIMWGGNNMFKKKIGGWEGVIMWGRGLSSDNHLVDGPTDRSTDRPT
ncbi:hypothetical protein DPMN_124273 [Dreissena polymorpha]|uniref:Uncharacterized protein n=1 Tax=Dreissena polymorpha TaxID=45954 RepID=A0A9D4GW37_DREPO|nr:hypothetical protein DPMN_124273 [Dreissena polymorpha]